MCCSLKEMEHTMKRWIVTTLVAGMFILGASTSHRTADADEADYEALNLIYLDESIPLPDVSLPDLKGDPVPLLSFRHHVVIINFWTTWCHYCERERAALEALYQIYKEDGLAVLAVNMGETVEQVRAYIEKHGLSFPHVMDPEARAEQAFGIQATPTNYLIDRRGHVVAGGMGYRDWTGPQAHRLIQRLLAAGVESR